MSVKAMKEFDQLPGVIRQMRQTKGFSQENVADELGISTSAYGDLERGKTEITLKRLYSLAKMFEVSLEELLGSPKDDATEMAVLKEENRKLFQRNLDLTFRNLLLEARLKSIAVEDIDRTRIGF